MMVLLIMGLIYSARTRRIPAYAKIYFDQGLQCESSCSLKERLRYFQKAIYHSPRWNQPYYKLADVYNEMGNSQKAVDTLLAVIHFDPDNPRALFYVGRQFFKQKDLGNADLHFSHAISNHIFIVELYWYIAQILKEGGDEAESQLYIDKARMTAFHSYEANQRLRELGFTGKIGNGILQ